METLRRKWSLLRNYKRVRALWEEFRRVSDLGNPAEMKAKLAAFVDSFQAASVELQREARGDLDRVYGDLTDVLLVLMDLVDREEELVDRALSVVEVILRDPKYQTIVKETPNLINRILSLLETLKSTEAKKHALRLISSLGSSSKEYRMEIGRHNGFRKILEMLEAGDDELTKEILHTLKHLLDTRPPPHDVAKSAYLLPPAATSTTRSLEGGDASVSSPALPHTLSALGVFARRQIGFLATEMSRLLVSEVNRFFPVGSGQKPPEEESIEDDTRNPPPASIQQDEADFCFMVNLFPPHAQMIERALAEVEQREGDKRNRDVSLSDDREAVEGDTGPRATTISDHLGREPSRPPQTEEEMLQEFMRVQGALSSLTDTLRDAALSMKLDLMDTIGRILFNNYKNQQEFMKLDGYSLFLRLFDQITDESPTDEQKDFLKNCFDIIFAIVLDGDPSNFIGNVDALRFLFRIISVSKHPDVRMHALQCLKDIVCINPLNAVFFLRVDGVKTLLDVVEDECGGTLLSSSTTANPGIESGPASARLARGSTEHFWPGDLLQKIMDPFAPDTHFSRALNELLSYIHFLVSNRSDDVLMAYVERIKRHPHVSLLETVAGLLADGNARFGSNPAFFEHRNRRGRELLCLFVGLLRDISSETVEELPDVHVSPLGDFAAMLPLCRLYGHSNPHVIALLEIVGLLVKGPPVLSESLDSIGGFELLCEIIVTCSLVDVRDFALFLLQDFVTLDPGNIKWFVYLLHSDMASSTRSAILDALTTVFHSNAFVRNVRAVFRAEGGLASLIAEIKAGPKNQVPVTAALRALGASFWDCENNKIWLVENVGLWNFTTLLVDLGVPVTSEVVHDLLELSCIGSLRGSLGARVADPTCIPPPPPSVSSFAANLRAPKSLYYAPLLCSRTLEHAFSISSTGEENGTSRSLRGSFSFRSRESDHASSVHQRGDELPTTSDTDVRLARPARRDSVVDGSSSPQLTPRDSPGNSPRSSPTFLATEAPSLVGGRTVDLVRSLTPIHFRSAEAVLAILHLIASESTPELQREVLRTIQALLEANPSSKSVLTDASGILVFLQMSSYFHDDEAQLACFQIVASLGSYDVSVREVRALFDLAFVSPRGAAGTERQMQLLYLIGRISEAACPPSFFNFDGCSGSLRLASMDRFPGSRQGYTLAFWMRVTAVLHDESSLLCWQDATGRTVLELFLRREKSTLTQHLVVRAQASPSAPEFASFPEVRFAESGPWHHIVMTHSRAGLTLFVDGRCVPAEPTITTSLPYVGYVSKDKPLTGHVGGRSATDVALTTRYEGQAAHRYFCGQIGPMYFFEGMWDISHAAEACRRGVAWNDSFRAMGIEHKLFFSVIPKHFVMKEEAPGDVQRLCEPLAASRFRDLAPLFESIELVRDGLLSKENNEVAGMEGGVEAHATRSFRSVLQKIGGVHICFPFLDMGPAQQVAGLRIMSSLLLVDDEATRMFYETHGLLVLEHLLRSSPSLSFETFDVLLEIVCEPSLPRIIRHPEDLDVVLDLLVIVNPSLQKRVVNSLVGLITSNSDNMRIWRAGPGLSSLFHLLDTLAADVRPRLLQLLESMIATFTLEEMDVLVDFLLDETVEDGQEVRRDVLETLYGICESGSHITDLLVKLGGYVPLLFLLESPLERVRVTALKLLGLINTFPKNKAVFLKAGGYDTMRDLLLSFPITASVCKTVLGVCLESFHVRAPRLGRSGTETSVTTTTSIPRLVNPELIHVLLCLIGRADSADVQRQFLRELERLMEPRNISILLETNFLEWYSSLFGTLAARDDTGPVLAQAMRTIVEILIFDMSLALKCPRIVRLREMVDVGDFQVATLEAILSYFEANPYLSDVLDDGAFNVLHNFGLLFEGVEELAAFTPSLAHRIINCVSTLAVSNTSSIRDKLKSFRLFDIRDNLLLFLLRGDAKSEVVSCTIRNISFGPLALSSKFRDEGGLLHFLRILHESASDTELQVVVGDVLRHEILPVEENRKAAARILEDPMVLSWLDPDKKYSRPPSPATDGPSEDLTLAEDGVLPGTTQAFLAWYYDEERRPQREAIETRLAKMLAPVEAGYRKNQEKVNQRRVKRARLRKEKMAKLSQLVAKTVSETVKVCRQKAAQCTTANRKREGVVVEGRGLRVSEGQRMWEAVRSRLRSTSSMSDDSSSTSDCKSDRSRRGRGTHKRGSRSPAGGTATSTSPVRGVDLMLCELCGRSFPTEWDGVFHTHLEHGTSRSAFSALEQHLVSGQGTLKPSCS